MTGRELIGEATDPPAILEERIEIRWRDLDAYQHVYNCLYLTYLEEARDARLAAALPRGARPGTSCSPAWPSTSAGTCARATNTSSPPAAWSRSGRSNITTREEVRTLHGELSAEAESVIVARDAATGRARVRLTAAEREALGRDRGSWSSIAAGLLLKALTASHPPAAEPAVCGHARGAGARSVIGARTARLTSRPGADINSYSKWSFKSRG